MKIRFDELAGQPDMAGRAAWPIGRKLESKDSGMNI